MSDSHLQQLNMKPGPRFAFEEEPGDACGSTRQPWIGAFERVLGDQECLSTERRPNKSGLHRDIPASPMGQARPDPVVSRGALPDECSDGQHSSAVSSANSASGGSSPLASVVMSDPMSLRPSQEPKPPFHRLGSACRDGTHDNGPSRSHSRSEDVRLAVGMGEDSTASSMTTLVSPRTQSSSSPGPQYSVAPLALPEKRWLDLDPQAASEGLATAVRKDSGPALISITPNDALIFEQAYVNHAPCVHKLTIQNQNQHQSVLVRMETNLSQGLSFMRRKRSAPKNNFEPCAWPSNSLAWARMGGLTPENLRGWRHVIANLENASSFILDPEADTTVYAMLRPLAFTTEGESDHLQALTYKSPASPAFSETPRFERSLEDAMTARSEVGPWAPSSPVSTPAALGEQLEPFGSYRAERGDPEPVLDSVLASPRSAPELSAAPRSNRTPLSAKPQHSSFDVCGSITARAWALPRAEAPSTEEGTEAPLSSWSSASSSRPTSFYGSSHSSTAATTSSFSLPDESSAQNTTILVSANCCRPFMDAILQSYDPASVTGTSPSPIEVDFGDVLVGQTQTQVLMLRNMSEIDCFCQATMEEARNMLQLRPITLIDCEDRSPVPMISKDDDSVTHNPFALLPRSSRRIELRLSPQEPCRDYEQVVAFRSLHDSSNNIRVVVRANILGVAKDDSLAVLSGDILDFGDCYGGHWTRQLLVLKNTADVLLDVQFGAQKGMEVTFQLAELAPQGEEDISTDEEIPVSSIATEMSLPTGSESGTYVSSVAEPNGVASANRSQGSDAEFEPAATASELAKTPTSRAQATPAEAEPPRLELSNLEALSSVTSKGARLSDAAGDGDDLDASSVASQQGSKPNSPTEERFSAGGLGLSDRLESSAKESLASRLERVDTGPVSDMERSQSLRAGMLRAAGDSDQHSVSTNVHSQTSSGFLSRPSSRQRFVDARTSDATGHEDAGSAKSDATALSRDSRMGPYPATSSSHAGSSTSGKPTRSALGRALSGLRNVEQAHSNQLEELVLRPGGEYRVVVSYRPERSGWDDECSGGRLVERSFRISLDYARSRSGSTRTKGGRERRTIVCQSRTCTSFISVSPKLIDLGEVQVGTRKSAHIAVTNRSELTARVDLRFVSKVLSMYRDEVSIPALQTVELKVESFPRRVNEAYRKQITVANLLNRHDDQIFDVRSVNVDKQRISFHSLFYRLLTPTGSNFIDFGDVNINSTRIRTFTIENTSGSRLSLELSAAHPEDVTLYVKATSANSLARPVSAADPGDKSTSLRGSTGHAEVEAADTIPLLEAEGKSRAQKPMLKGPDLKERFLETISLDSPASIRNENTSWRLAQKQSHFARKEVSVGAPAQKNDQGVTKPKPQINLVSALKKGGKGRITIVYGKATTFKDRSLLRDFEYLDLATGPPVDARRISAKSKRYNMLESIATGGKGKHSSVNGQGKAKSGTTDAKHGEGLAPPGTKKEARARTPASSSLASSSSKSNAERRFPSPLAKDIRVTGSIKTAKARSVQPSMHGVLKGDGETRSESTTRVHFSPALTGKRKAAPVLSNSADVSRMSLEDLLAAVEAQNSTLSTFFLGSSQAEEHCVRTEINLQRELRLAIENQRLRSINILDIPAGSETQVIAVYHPSGSTRPHVQGNARKQDSRIFMRLVEFNADVVRASSEFAGMADLDIDELPVRDLMTRSNTCRSLLELGQPHINFGHMEKGDAKARKILIQNRSEWALRYCIRKSGSIASGDIKFSSGRYGVVPGYGKREVEFLFSPSMSGAFQEKVVVENVADRDNDQVVYLKANVRKVPNFAVDPSTIDFGALVPGKVSTPESFVLSNTTSKARSFVIAIDPHGLLFQRCIVDVALRIASDGDVKGTLTRDEEEEVENLSQKLKIASRKGNLDKVKKYEERLSKLGVKPASPTLPAADEARTGPESSENKAAASVRQGIDATTVDDVAEQLDSESGRRSSNLEVTLPKLKRISSNVTCTLAPNQSKRLVLQVRASAIQSAIRPDQADPSDRGGPEKAGVEEVEVAVKVHEVKNQDETKVVALKANVEFELLESGAQARETEAMPIDAVVFTPLNGS